MGAVLFIFLSAWGFCASPDDVDGEEGMILGLEAVSCVVQVKGAQVAMFRNVFF